MLKHFASNPIDSKDHNVNSNNTLTKQSVDHYLVSTSYDKMLNVFLLSREDPGAMQLIYKYEMPTLITDMIPFYH